jgi:apolipoprotein N-acyltransferase
VAGPGSDISRYKLLAAAASGLLLTLSFPKIGHPALALCAMVPLLLTLRAASFAGGFKLGFITGLVHFVSLVYWAAYTMKIYGHLPLYLCIPLLILLAAYLALYPALFAGLTTLIRRPLWLLLFIPVFWTASEYLRAALFTGFPWELLGYSQYRNLPFIQIADITGIYGVSFWLALINAALLLTGLGLWRKPWQERQVSNGGVIGVALTALAFSGILWGYRAILTRIKNGIGRFRKPPSKNITPSPCRRTGKDRTSLSGLKPQPLFLSVTIAP